MDAVIASKGAAVNTRNSYQLQTAFDVFVEHCSETFPIPYSRTSCQLIIVMNAMGTFSISTSSSNYLAIIATFRFQLVCLKQISSDAA